MVETRGVAVAWLNPIRSEAPSPDPRRRASRANGNADTAHSPPAPATCGEVRRVQRLDADAQARKAGRRKGGEGGSGREETANMIAGSTKKEKNAGARKAMQAIEASNGRQEGFGDTSLLSQHATKAR